jgi:hypothetical protein
VLADLGDDESAQYCLERAAALYREHSGDRRPVSATVAVQVNRRQRGGARWMNLLRREP